MRKTEWRRRENGSRAVLDIVSELLLAGSLNLRSVPMRAAQYRIRFRTRTSNFFPLYNVGRVYESLLHDGDLSTFCFPP